MQKEVIFPTAEELEYLALQKISDNPKLSHSKAIEQANVELMQVRPESFNSTA